MRITSVNASNFLSFGEPGLALRFGTKGLTQIQGINHDSPSSESNGAGKSAVYEAVLYGLYGITKRGLRGDDVINRHAPKTAPCAVCVVFEKSGVFYSVCRVRRAPAGEPPLKLLSGASELKDLTKGTAAETQALLESIIGMSPLTFVKMTSFGQGDLRPFTALRDSELKTVMEQACGIEFIHDHHLLAKAHAASIKSSIDAAESSLVTILHEIEMAVLSLEESTKSAEAWDDRRVEKIEEMRKVVVENLRRAKELRDTAEAKQKRFVELETAAADSIAKLKEFARLDADLDKKIHELTILSGTTTAEIKAASRAMDDVERLVKGARMKIGSPCSECGKVYGPADMDGFITAQVKKGESQLKVINDKTPVRAAVDKKIAELKSLKVALKSKAEVCKKATATLETYRSDVLPEARLAVSEADRLTASSGDLGKKIEALRAEKNPFETRRIAKEAELESLHERERAVRADLESLAGDATVAGHLVAALGNAGLKNYVFNGITPELNRMANQYLSMLDDIDVEISTVKKLKSGELRDKFEISVNNRSGAKEVAGNSGGEQQKINLAIALAFNAVVRSTVASGVNILFLDEPFESLDAGSAESVVDLLTSLAGANDVYLISHNPAIKDLVARTITIEKRGGAASSV